MHMDTTFSTTSYKYDSFTLEKRYDTLSHAYGYDILRHRLSEKRYIL